MMNDSLKAFMQSSGMEQPNFAPNSRYYALDTAEWTRPDGQVTSYVKRRFIAQPENFSILQEHLVQQNDRLDNIAASYFSDPQLYWRLCDANAAMNPADLTAQTGTRLRITLSEGVVIPTES